MTESKKILVVDDEEHVVAAIKTNLEVEGYRVLPAYSGQEALELVGREKPDLIVLDVMMPEMDGWEVLDRLKAQEQTAEIPVVMLTALSQDEDIIRGWEGGAHAYLTKPFDPAKLVRIIGEQLALQEKRQAR
ncbi:MAG TPA: response regulator [Armatimonadetes bacterium]|nr:response regulator [Armatimonadota bacterium]